MRRAARAALWTVGVAVLALVAFGALTPIGRYLCRAAWSEGWILAHRRPIQQLVHDPSVDEQTRAKLELVLAARRFAADSMHLDARESFTQFTQLRRDTLVLVVSAAYRDTLARYSWWFPVVGRVPYKGFFDFAAAYALACDLERRGFDAYVRPASAFSTLGWFNDPLLSTTLAQDSVDLAATVIHELTHNTFYAPGQAVFNESFAEFVGSHGAEWFFALHGDSAAVRRARRRWTDEKLMARFYAAVYQSLDSAFRAHPGDANRTVRLRARDTVFARARAWFANAIWPQMEESAGRPAPAVRLDNAVVLSRRVYTTDLELFDFMFASDGGDVRRATRTIIGIATDHPDDPYRGMVEWLRAQPGTRSPEEDRYLAQWLAAHAEGRGDAGM